MFKNEDGYYIGESSKYKLTIHLDYGIYIQN